ncbi:hypothetical protein OHB56_37925 [Streptomyces sp. NBC_01635]|uniref:hypothetical protein n=1 Tax=Streptomyces sp. NBC_01635 TaxID=2975904 RepID=UPI00386E831D|nr:hypothetical protein OHB56_37925 [Streptomyces sp. NBC_01635]
MHLVIGLGSIGGNLGTHLAEKRREVYGYDLDTARRRVGAGVGLGILRLRPGRTCLPF